MHIPDGFLDVKTAVGTGVLAAVGLALALRSARRTLPPRKVPLLGLSAAFVFAAQMINFPIPMGTSGHLLGGVLAAALLGPSAAVIVLSTVLILQCFAFADGGITALGANIFNMAIVGTVGGWAVYAGLVRWVSGGWGIQGRLFAAIVAAWSSTVLAAVACTGELTASQTTTWGRALPAMVGFHMLIGLGEGVITALVLSSIASVRPELVVPVGERTPVRSMWPLLVYGLLGALGLVWFVFPFASQAPDGLEAVSRRLNFDTRQQEHAALWSNYTAWTAALAVVFIFAAGLLLARLLVARRAAE